MAELHVLDDAQSEILSVEVQDEADQNDIEA